MTPFQAVIAFVAMKEQDYPRKSSRLDGHAENIGIGRPARRRRTWAGIMLVLAGLALYLITLDNGFSPEELRGGDLITHQYAQVQARPGNAPGYPLYTMGGWLWFHGLRGATNLLGVTQPNPIPILSSYSIFWALLAIWLLYGIVCRITRNPRHPAGNWLLAWLISAFYAVTYFFWYYATTTEQYSSAIAQTLAIVYVYMLWSDAEYSRHNAQGGISDAELRAPNAMLFLLAFLCGLSLAHMLTIAFIVPPLVLVILWQAPYLLRSLRIIVGVVVAAALPLLGYLYVYLRGAAHPEWWGRGKWETANEWFWAFVSTSQGREELGWVFEPSAAFFGNGFPELMWVELSIPFFIIGILGILLLDRKLTVLLYGFMAITLAFSWAYRYGNWYQVILPVYPLILLGVAGVFAVAENRVARWSETETAQLQRWLPLAPLLLIVIAIGWRLNASLPAANSHNRPGDSALDRAAILLDQPLPTDPLLFTAVDDALALQFLIDIWGIRPDAIPATIKDVRRNLAAGNLVLATWEGASILDYELPDEVMPAIQSHSADWLLITPTNVTPPGVPAQIIDGQVTENVLLHGFTVNPSPDGLPVYPAAPGLDITLFWSLTQDAWPEDLRISVRPTLGEAFMPDPNDPAAIIQRDLSKPAQDMLTIAPGTPVSTLADAYRFEAAQTADGFMVIVYQPTSDGFENVAEFRLSHTK